MSTKINTKKGITPNTLVSFFASTGITILGEACFADIITTSFGTAAGGVIGGPIGIGIGFGIGIIIGGITLLVEIKRKEKRYRKGLIDFMKKIQIELNEAKNISLNNLNFWEDDLTRTINLELVAIESEINGLDQEEWEKLRNEYIKNKENIMKILEEQKID